MSTLEPSARAGLAVGAGDWIQHERYGIGVIVSVRGDGRRAQACINFSGEHLWVALRGAPIIRLAHDCADGLIACPCRLMDDCVRTCPMCGPICLDCLGAACFPPGWLVDPVEIAELFVFHLAHGFRIEMCPGCDGVVGMESIA